jgi:hypothetical protein
LSADEALFEPFRPRRPMDDYRVITINGYVNVLKVPPDAVSGYEVYAIILQDRTRIEFRYGLRFFQTTEAFDAWVDRINEGGAEARDFAYIGFDGSPDRFADPDELTALIHDCWEIYTLREALFDGAPA